MAWAREATAAVALGVVAWWIVGEAWVQFDALVPMLAVAAALVGIGLVVAVGRRWWGAGIGLAVSAAACAAFFATLSVSWVDIG